jgi:hypothetical protein
MLDTVPIARLDKLPLPVPSPSATLLLQMLAWIAEKPRDYGETMDAWRTSCPRLSIWEDALGDQLVEIDARQRGSQSTTMVRLTDKGIALLAGAHALTTGAAG